MNPFNPCDSATWPVMLTADQIAAIWQRPVGGVLKAVQASKFIPAPCERRPSRWRKADVVRYVEGARASMAWRRVS
jgi:hypothetical protein